MRRLSRWRSTPVSARARIVGWLALLVSFALLVMVVVVGRVVIARVDTGLENELAHEGAKLRAFAERGVDPATGQPFRSSAELLGSFLRDNLPDEDETFFSVVDGRARSRSPQAPLARLDLQPSTVAAAATAQSPVLGATDSAAGPARYAVFPVRVAGDPSRASLVAVEFAEPARTDAWRLVRILATVGFGALAAAAAGSWLVAGRVLAPIRVVREAASRIGETDLSERLEVTGDDEVAHLAQTFNAMLDRLESAFEGQRRFLDDASHELRTPLTVVRGHLELMDDDPAEREQTRVLVLDELDRMTRLVDDLMLLARSEQPGFVRLAPVDLADLVVEVAAKARPLSPRRWVIDELAETTVAADGQRLTQALLQLAANAVAHTQEDDVIGFGASVDDGLVNLWVRDSGTGIDPARHDQVFRRASRGEADRSSQGLGLGLAIVSSIAGAHGGSVRLDSAVGVGSRFTLELPAVAAAAAAPGGDR
jgi:signal transduction histidine kinase